MLLLIVFIALLAPRETAAQTPSASERDTIVRLHVERGGRAEEVEPLLRISDEAARKGLPIAPLVNKIREGLAKNVALPRIEAVVRDIAGNLETADRFFRQLTPELPMQRREAALTLLGEALASGVTSEQVRELARQTETPGRVQSADALASAAKALSLIKDARLPVADGTAVMAEAGRQGFRPDQLLDVGREVKRREQDYQAGRASLRSLREAIARGERPEQLFRDKPTAPERPTATAERPAEDRPVTRPERPARPEAQRPDPAARPEPPTRPGNPR